MTDRGGSQSLSKQNLRFALGYIQGRRALSLILLFHSVDELRVCLEMCSMQTRFKGCVGVRSGPKGPVIDLSIVGLESLSKQNLGFALGYVQSEPQGPVIHSSICGGAPGRLGNMFKHSTVWRPQCLSNQNLRFALVSPAVVTDPGESQSLSKQNLRFALWYIQGRRALSLILLFHSVDELRVCLEMCSMQTKFKVCVGVRSGPKGPVIDLSIVGLESLSKQNLGFALGYVQSEPQGPVIHSSICGGAPGRLGNMFKHSTVWRPQCLSNQNLRFALGYVAPNPCPFASREGLGGGATLVHLQVVKGCGGPQPLSICKS